jgi:hypothetical protein
MAPKNSKIDPKMMACQSLRDLADTEDPKAFATSLAPMPKAKMKPQMTPRTAM